MQDIKEIESLQTLSGNIRMRALIRMIAILFIWMAGSSSVVAEDHEWQAKKRMCDSLKNVLATQTLTPAEETSIRWKIVNGYVLFAVDSVIAYAPYTIELAHNTGEHFAEMDCLSHLGASYCFVGEYDKGIACFEQLEKKALQRNDKRFQERALGLIAFAYMQQGKYNTAIDYYMKALPLCEQEEEWLEGRVMILSNLGEIYRKLNNPVMALQYLDEATVQCEGLKQVHQSRFEWRIPQIYNEYAAIYLQKKELDKATRYALEADSINTGIGIINKCNTKILLANIFMQRGGYDRALEYAAEAMTQADMLKDNYLRMQVWHTFSTIYLMRGMYPEAEAYALKILEIGSTDIAISREAAANLVQANMHTNNIRQASYYFGKYSELNDRYSDKSFHNTISDMAIKYETNKKEMRIASLENERRLYVWLGVAGILLLSALVIVLLQTIRNARREKQLIATRSVLDGEMKERTRLAHDLHDRLSGNLSAIKIELNNYTDSLNDVRGRLDNCIRDIRSAAHNLMPVSLQYGLKTALSDFATQFPNVHFHFFGEEKNLDERLEFVIYCCASELVNNSIRHSGADAVNIQLVQDEKYITLTVQDDGCGFDEKTVRKGLGLKSIYDRVASCNGKIDIQTSPGQGTETMIEFNIENLYR